MSDFRLILFDIDCTLLRTGGSGMVALSQALAQVLQRPFQLSKVPPSGQTDPNIVRAMFQEVDLPVEHWEECERQIFQIYPQLLAAQLLERKQDSRLEPGVDALVELLHEHPELHLGVLTGNLEVTARMKLDVFGLNPYFPVGAFGSDCADRNQLGPIALERARQHYGRDFRPERTWFIGDTHHDINAARACGARVLAVATGSYSQADLQEFLPDHCLEHLLEAERVLELLLAL
ncbi:HAD family hydrolase [bacterium]|nr:HAD family hydrolase [bacterium]